MCAPGDGANALARSVEELASTVLAARDNVLVELGRASSNAQQVRLPQPGTLARRGRWPPLSHSLCSASQLQSAARLRLEEDLRSFEEAVRRNVVLPVSKARCQSRTIHSSTSICPSQAQQISSRLFGQGFQASWTCLFPLSISRHLAPKHNTLTVAISAGREASPSTRTRSPRTKTSTRATGMCPCGSGSDGKMTGPAESTFQTLRATRRAPGRRSSCRMDQPEIDCGLCINACPGRHCSGRLALPGMMRAHDLLKPFGCRVKLRRSIRQADRPEGCAAVLSAMASEAARGGATACVPSMVVSFFLSSCHLTAEDALPPDPSAPATLRRPRTPAAHG